jgi:CheY-like chemotaxis protein
MLPKMDGYALNAQLLKNAKTSEIPVVVVTSQSARENSMLNAKNVKAYVQKPFDPMDLLSTIRKILTPS